MSPITRARAPRDLSELFPELPDWFGRRRLLSVPESWRDLMEEMTIRVEEYEEDGTLVIRAEMPGIDPDHDVEMTVEDHTLRIKAERRQESTVEDKKGYRSEFQYGSFFRQVPLPAGASEKDVQASYHDGILEVRVPISPAEAEAKKIPITHA